MTRQTWYLIGAVIIAILAWFIFRPGSGARISANLVDQLATAREKRPNPDVFSAVDATIGGVKKRAIRVKEFSRLVYDVTVPEDGELRFSLAIEESEWTKEGDGVLFRVLVGTEGAAPTEVINVQLNPFSVPADRGWHDMTVDLSEYSGETIQIFFNTNDSPPSRPQKDDHNGDISLWGDPRVVAR